MFQLVDHGDCIILDRNLAFSSGIDQELIVPQAKPSRSLSRFQSCGRRQKRPIQLRLPLQLFERVYGRQRTGLDPIRHIRTDYDADTGFDLQSARPTDPKDALFALALGLVPANNLVEGR